MLKSSLKLGHSICVRTEDLACAEEHGNPSPTTALKLSWGAAGRAGGCGVVRRCVQAKWACSLEPRLSAVTLSPKHTLLANPSAAAFDLGFICGCCVFRNLSVCQIRHGFHIQLPLGSGSCGGGEPRLSHGAQLLIGTSTWNTAALQTTSSFGGNEFCHWWPSVLKWSCCVT